VDRHRARTDGNADTSAVLRGDVPSAPGHDAVAPGHVHPAIDGVRLADTRLHGHETARTQRHNSDFVDHRHKDRSKRSIDGIAARAGHPLAGSDCGLVGSGDGDVSHKHKRY
jgi:hypothetical protein